ncbi:hypothetical protein GCM10027046_03720 [Uliginosibacterium flavum]
MTKEPHARDNLLVVLHQWQILQDVLGEVLIARDVRILHFHTASRWSEPGAKSGRSCEPAANSELADGELVRSSFLRQEIGRECRRYSAQFDHVTLPGRVGHSNPAAQNKALPNPIWP